MPGLRFWGDRWVVSAFRRACVGFSLPVLRWTKRRDLTANWIRSIFHHSSSETNSAPREVERRHQLIYSEWSTRRSAMPICSTSGDAYAGLG